MQLNMISGGDDGASIDSENDAIMKRILPGNHTSILSPESYIGTNGRKGYVHNPIFLNKNPKPFTIPKDQNQQVFLPPGKSFELPDMYAALRKIRNHVYASQEDQDVKLFYTIYTYSGGVNKTTVVSDT